MNDLGTKGIGGVIKKLCLYIGSVHQVFCSEVDEKEKEGKKN